MNAIKIDATIDEALAQVLPAFRPLLGKHVELIALETPPLPPERKLTVDELLASRIKPPPEHKLTLDELLADRLERPEGVAPVTLDDMERAIAEGALGHAFR